MPNILVITYWNYSDALIQTYTLPYVRLIRKYVSQDSQIFLITLEKDRGNLSRQLKKEVRSKLTDDGITWLPLNYYPYGWKAALYWMLSLVRLSGLIIKKKITILHCFATPAGAIGYLLSFLLNRKLIVDSYEPHSESMVENGTWKKASLAFKILFWLEKKQTQKASQVIATTMGMKSYAKVKYGIDIQNFHVKPACVDLGQFSRINVKNEELLVQFNLQSKIVCVYAGKFGGIYLDKEVFDLFKVASDYWGDLFRVLILTGHGRDEIISRCNRSEVDPSIVISMYVNHKDIARYIGLADFAITPVKPVPSKRYCTPIKNGEYWALGLPVIITDNISDDSRIIKENSIGVIITDNSFKGHNKVIEQMDELLRMPKEERFAKIRSIAERYRSFDVADKVYKEIYHNKS